MNVKSLIVFKSITGGVFAGSGQSLLLEGVVSVPLRGRFALRVFSLRPGTGPAGKKNGT